MPVKRANRKRRRNVEMGFWSGGKFHPIRASDDYDPEDVGERYQWKPAKKKKKKKNMATKTNKKKRKTAKKKMKRGSKSLAAWVRSQTNRKRKNAAPKANRKRNPPKRTNAKHNPRHTRAVIPRSGSTGWMKAREVNIITKGGKVKEVKVKR